MMKRTLFLGAFLLLVLSGCSQTAKTPENTFLSSTEAKNKVKDFVNQYMIQEGQEKARVSNVSEEGGIYKVVIELQDQSIDTYVTKDGKKFFPQAIDMENPEKQLKGSQPGEQGQAQSPQGSMSSSEQAEMMITQGRDLLDQYGEKVSEEERNNFGEKLNELEELNQSDNIGSGDLEKKMQEVQETSGPLVNEAMKEKQKQQQGGNATPAPQSVE